MSFVNSIWTSNGGTHVNYITNQLANAIIGALEKQTKLEMNVLPSPLVVRNKLFFVLSALIENPSFDSQTKDTLTTKPSKFGSTFELPNSFLKTFVQDSGFLEELIEDMQKKVFLSFIYSCNIVKCYNLDFFYSSILLFFFYYMYICISN